MGLRRPVVGIQCNRCHLITGVDLCVACQREIQGKQNRGDQVIGAFALASYVTGRVHWHPITSREARD